MTAPANHPDPPARTKFERFVEEITARELAVQLANRGTSTRASLGVIYAWIRGEHEPRSPKRRAIVQISRGKLTLEDIDAHFEAKKRK